jgi:molecular chaperone GrpE
MTEENGVAEIAIRENLLDRLRACLDEASALNAGEDAEDESSDLYSVLVEVAGLRNEARAQARHIKDALDQFRSVFETLQSSNAALDRELKEARVGAGEQVRTLLRPVLLDMLDVRDRLAAGLAASTPESKAPWWAFWRRKTTAADPWREGANPWREGMEMTLRRLDRALTERRVTPVTTIGRPFAASVARAVATRDDPSVADGCVIAETRAGFEWNGEVLRTAEVIVSKHTVASDRSNEGNV